MRDWLLRMGPKLENESPTALGYYILRALASIVASGVRPYDYGTSNLGVSAMDTLHPELRLFDLASYVECSERRFKLNLDNLWKFLGCRV